MTIELKKLDFSCASDEFRVAVQGCGVRVEISADGKVTVYSNSETKQPTPTLATTASAEALKR
jgi:CO/xanthine dehydrogenase Mo-binding subunit